MYIDKLCATANETLDAISANIKIRKIQTKLRILGLVVNGLANSSKF